MLTTDTYAAAVHEAGHVVCAVALGVPVVDAFIDNHGGGKVSAVIDYLSPEDQCVFIIAGQVAETLVFGDCPQANVLRVDRDLFDRAVMAVWPTWKRAALMQSAQQRARVILRTNIDVLHRVADALQLKRNLSGSDLNALTRDIR